MFEGNNFMIHRSSPKVSAYKSRADQNDLNIYGYEDDNELEQI